MSKRGRKCVGGFETRLKEEAAVQVSKGGEVLHGGSH